MKDTVEAELKRIEEERWVDEMNREELIELAPHEDERDFLEKVVRSSKQPMNRRVRAAMELLAYKYPKLGAIATTKMNGKDFASLLERAIERSNRKTEVKLIEGHAIAPGDDAG